MIIAATGHRPEKLGGYSPVVLSRLTDLATAYFSRTFPTKIISGMALAIRNSQFAIKMQIINQIID